MSEHPLGPSRSWGRRLRARLHAMPGMITCAKFEATLLAYLEGTLSWRQRWVMKLHLLACPACRAYLKAYRATVALGHTVFEDPHAPVPDSVPEDLVAAVLDVLEREGRS